MYSQGMLALYVAVIGIAVTAVAIFFGLRGWLTGSRDEFIDIRKHLREERVTTLATAAFGYYSGLKGDMYHGGGEGAEYTGPVLYKRDWLPASPMKLERVRIILEMNADRQNEYGSILKKASKLLPHRPGAIWFHNYHRYSQAVSTLDRPSLFSNRNAYRLLSVEPDHDSFSLRFTAGKYFDHHDTEEVLAYEIARYFVKHDDDRAAPETLPRMKVRDTAGYPANFGTRCAVAGINTLTVYENGGRFEFVLHRRSERDVAQGKGSVHVIPAGEFQPTNDGAEALSEDFDLWKNIMREYDEELLGTHDQEARPVPDYAADKPFRELDEARKTGRLQLYFLGVVIDPINLKPQILTCAVFHGSSFQEIFRKPVTRDDEGTVLWSGSGKKFTGYAFNPSNLLSQASYPASPTTQALLRIASRNTERLCGAG